MSTGSASLGLLAKTGRAIAIVLAGTAQAPRILSRGELTLHFPGDTIGPYHVVMDLAWPAALVAARPAVRAIQDLATRALQTFLEEVSSAGTRVTAVGVAGSMGQDPARIGNPHIRAHAAEGQLYREVLETAAESCGLARVSFSTKRLAEEAAVRLGAPAADLESRVAALGKGVVKPWRAEERAAALAGWAALAGSPTIDEGMR